jgi:hypothetical protein
MQGRYLKSMIYRTHNGCRPSKDVVLQPSKLMIVYRSPSQILASNQGRKYTDTDAMS